MQLKWPFKNDDTALSKEIPVTINCVKKTSFSMTNNEPEQKILSKKNRFIKHTCTAL